MAYDVIHKNSTVAGTPPAAGEIEVGEIAINAADAELYVKDTSGNIRKFQNTTTGTADGVNFTQAGTGAVQRTVESKLQDVVSVKDFGAAGDGVTDDTAAVEAAYAWAQANYLSTILFPRGIYIIKNTISLGGSRGITFIGEIQGGFAQGSSGSSVILRWTGGASPMFTTSVSNINFFGFTIENYGTATHFIDCTFTMLNRLERVHVDGSATGCSPFSTAFVSSTDRNIFGYSTISDCRINDPAPYAFRIAAPSYGNGTTTIQFRNNIINSDAEPLTFFSSVENSFDVLSFENNTFNGNAADSTFIDLNSNGSGLVASLIVKGNEFETKNTADEVIKLYKTTNATFIGNHLSGSGSAIEQPIAIKESSHAYFVGNYCLSYTHLATIVDATSSADVSQNYNTDSTLRSLLRPTGFEIYKPYLDTSNDRIYVNPNMVGRSGVVLVELADSTAAYNIYHSLPTNSGLYEGLADPGKTISIIIRNTSGAALNLVKFRPEFKMNGNTITDDPLTTPGVGQQIVYTFATLPGNEMAFVSKSDVYSY